MTNDDLFSINPFSLNRAEKALVLTRKLMELTLFHRERCEIYKNVTDALGFDPESVSAPEDFPFLPVRMFKNHELLSVPRDQIFKTMTSSGTTGQRVSKIFVDRQTGMEQQKALIRIMSDFVGKKRLPMLIIDSPEVIKNRNMFSARGAAILGLRMLATEAVYALTPNMELDLELTRDFLASHNEGPFLCFGFTFMVWHHLYEYLKERGLTLDLSRAHLITGGGWKKLVSLNISGEEFRQALNTTCGITSFVDHYGMVEQTGCVYAQCPCGHLHASIFSDILIRRPGDFSLCDKGEEGIIQVVSVLPHSYPGHSLLTEDMGILLGEDDCPCGRRGKYFKVTGRLKSAELRGCSDTYAAKF